MIYDIYEQIAYLTQVMTLMPGDILATGTPSGIGAPTGRFLRVGDVVRAEIEGLGAIENRVVADPIRGVTWPTECRSSSRVSVMPTRSRRPVAMVRSCSRAPSPAAIHDTRHAGGPGRPVRERVHARAGPHDAVEGTPDDIVKMTFWLADYRDREALNREWLILFPDAGSRPARHVVKAELDDGVLAQADLIAIL